MKMLVTLGMGIILLSSIVHADSPRNAPKKTMEMTTKQVISLMDLSYGRYEKQRLDVYRPENAHNAPIIVMVHGGAWRLGDKQSQRVVANKVSRWNPKGILFISINYRLVPEVTPLQQADDIAQALTYIQTHARHWGGNPEHMILMGHSAGAHLVSLVSADPSHYADLQPWLGTIALDTAAMDLTTIMNASHPRFYDRAFGKDPALWEAASPFHRLHKSAPPMMLVCSTKRADSPCQGMKAFMTKATALGIPTILHTEALSHRKINETLGLPNGYTKAVEDFMTSVGISGL